MSLSAHRHPLAERCNRSGALRSHRHPHGGGRVFRCLKFEGCVTKIVPHKALMSIAGGKLLVIKGSYSNLLIDGSNPPKTTFCLEHTAASPRECLRQRNASEALGSALKTSKLPPTTGPTDPLSRHSSCLLLLLCSRHRSLQVFNTGYSCPHAVVRAFALFLRAHE